MNIPRHYRKPIIIAVIFHIILFLVLIFNFGPSLFRMPPSNAPMKTVHATTVSEASVQATVHEAEKNPEQKLAQEKAIEAQKRLRELARVREANMKKTEAVAKQKALVLQKQKMAALQIAAKQARAKASAKKMQAEKAEHEAQLKAAMAARAKASAKKMQAEKAAMEARAKASALVAQQKKLQQEMMQQQLNSEQKNISAVVSQAQQGAINKYKAEILLAIQSNWRIDQVNAKLKCVYSVSLAPDGTVLSVQLVKSSGDSALDQSAQQAITLASPLPVPHNPAVFNHFRQLVLTLSPQGILQSVGTA